MEELLFYAEVREGRGTGAARKIRAAGFIPGVLYGAAHSPCHIKLEKKTTEKIIRHLESHNVISTLILKHNGAEEKIKTLLKDIQIDPIRADVIHLDFYRIRMDKPIRMRVPIHLKGTAAGLEQGGILEHELRELEIQALPDRMPEQIEIDVSSMNIGDAIFVKDIKLADGLEIIDAPEKTIISLLAPKVVKEEVPEQEAAGEVATEVKEEVAEPEVITQQKVEERRKEKEKESQSKK